MSKTVNLCVYARDKQREGEKRSESCMSGREQKRCFHETWGTRGIRYGIAGLFSFLAKEPCKLSGLFC